MLSTVLEGVGRIQAAKPHIEDSSVYRQNRPTKNGRPFLTGTQLDYTQNLVQVRSGPVTRRPALTVPVTMFFRGLDRIQALRVPLDTSGARHVDDVRLSSRSACGC